MLSAELSVPDHINPARNNLIRIIEDQQHDRLLDREFGDVRPATLTYDELAITAGSMATAEATLSLGQGADVA